MPPRFRMPSPRPRPVGAEGAPQRAGGAKKERIGLREKMARVKPRIQREMQVLGQERYNPRKYLGRLRERARARKAGGTTGEVSPTQSAVLPPQSEQDLIIAQRVRDKQPLPPGVTAKSAQEAVRRDEARRTEARRQESSEQIVDKVKGQLNDAIAKGDVDPKSLLGRDRDGKKFAQYQEWVAKGLSPADAIERTYVKPAYSRPLEGAPMKMIAQGMRPELAARLQKRLGVDGPTAQQLAETGDFSGLTGDQRKVARVTVGEMRGELEAKSKLMNELTRRTKNSAMAPLRQAALQASGDLRAKWGGLTGQDKKSTDQFLALLYSHNGMTPVNVVAILGLGVAFLGGKSVMDVAQDAGTASVAA
ncbi:MAG: hypothetical protein ACREGI_01240 [Candidatus Levyibacteriota bacterium]